MWTRTGPAVTGIPDGLERAAIEASCSRPSCPWAPSGCGTPGRRQTTRPRLPWWSLWRTSTRARPQGDPGHRRRRRPEGCVSGPAEDTGVLRQMRRLLLDEEPRQAAGPGGPGDSVPSAASASSETRAQGAEPAARKAGPLRGGAAGGAETEAEAAGGPRGAGRPSGEGGPRTPGGSRTPRTPLPRAAWGSCCRGRSRATRARAPPRLRARCPPRCTRPPRS